MCATLLKGKQAISPKAKSEINDCYPANFPPNGHFRFNPQERQQKKNTDNESSVSTGHLHRKRDPVYFYRSPANLHTPNLGATKALRWAITSFLRKNNDGGNLWKMATIFQHRFHTRSLYRNHATPTQTETLPPHIYCIRSWIIQRIISLAAIMAL